MDGSLKDGGRGRGGQLLPLYTRLTCVQFGLFSTIKSDGRHSIYMPYRPCRLFNSNSIQETLFQLYITMNLTYLPMYTRLTHVQFRLFWTIKPTVGIASTCHTAHVDCPIPIPSKNIIPTVYYNEYDIFTTLDGQLTA